MRLIRPGYAAAPRGVVRRPPSGPRHIPEACAGTKTFDVLIPVPFALSLGAVNDFGAQTLDSLDSLEPHAVVVDLFRKHMSQNASVPVQL